jgi:hypothetical protein
MIRKTFKTILIVTGIILVVGIPLNYSSLIADKKKSFIYHPPSDRLFSVSNKIDLYEDDKWFYLIPFSEIFTEVIYGYHNTDYSTCNLGKLRDLELEEARKIKDYKSGKQFNVENFRKESDENFAQIKENLKKKYRYDYRYTSYHYYRGDLKIEKISNEIIFDAINKIPYTSITILKNEKDINTNIKTKHIGKPIDLFLLKKKMRHKFKNKIHNGEYELRFYEPEKNLLEDAILITNDGKYSDAFYNLNLKSYANKCTSLDEKFDYSD